MKTQRHFGRIVIFVVAASIGLLGARSAFSQETAPATTQATMRGLFTILSSIYGYSLDAKAFEDPANRQEILTKLQALASNASQLEAHGGGLDPSFELMRRSIARDAFDALADFRMKNYVGSRFVLNRITDNCVTCHTKLPSNKEFDLGHKFMEEIDVKGLPPAALANLQVATRQFSDAMKTYEQVLSSKDVTAEDLSTFDVFNNYLRISLGPMNDPKRPIQTFEKFVTRKDMPESLKNDVSAWIASLSKLNLDIPHNKELATAREVVMDASEKTKSPSDHSQMVEFISSITLLHRYLRTGTTSDVDAAEAYYLLGVAESYASHSVWISETEYLLEKFIRTAPKSAVAKQALAFLEEYRNSAYNVTPARAVPQELQTNIEALRALTQQ